MAGQQHTKRIQRLVAFLVLVCLAAGLARRAALSPRSTPPPSPHSTRRELVQLNLDPNRIHGRWEAVRASLGLPPLSHSHAVVFTPEPNAAFPGRPDKQASRFDLARKRAEEARRQLPRLHFAPDIRSAQPTTPRREKDPPSAT